MPNYSKGKIYIIKFHNSNEIYVGSTIQTLRVRFKGHKREIKSTSVYKLINTKYEGKWDKCYIELLEDYSCNNREELCKREGEYIRQFKNDIKYDCINCKIAGRTNMEYYEDNVEKLKEKNKQYRKDNPDKVKQLNQQYYQNNADKLIEQNKIYYENNIEKIKEYKTENADKIKEQKKKYYEKRKDKILEQRKEKTTCVCGSCISRHHLADHKKSKRHQEYLASLPTVIYASNENNS